MVLTSSEKVQLMFYLPVAPTVQVMGLGMVGLFDAKIMFSHDDQRDRPRSLLETLSLDLTFLHHPPSTQSPARGCAVIQKRS